MVSQVSVYRFALPSSKTEEVYDLCKELDVWFVWGMDKFGSNDLVFGEVHYTTSGPFVTDEDRDNQKRFDEAIKRILDKPYVEAIYAPGGAVLKAKEATKDDFNETLPFRLVPEKKGTRSFNDFSNRWYRERVGIEIQGQPADLSKLFRFCADVQWDASKYPVVTGIIKAADAPRIHRVCELDFGWRVEKNNE